MKIPTLSSLFTFLGKVLLGIVVGGFWYHPIVPFLFYITFADIDMKDQMNDGDLIEFHSIAYAAQKMSNEGISLNFEYKAVLVVKKVSELGFFIWIPVGVIWGFSTTQFYRKTKKAEEVTS